VLSLFNWAEIGRMMDRVYTCLIESNNGAGQQKEA